MLGARLESRCARSSLAAAWSAWGGWWEERRLITRENASRLEGERRAQQRVLGAVWRRERRLLMLAFGCWLKLVRIHAYVHTHIHVYIHTHTHTHTHTHHMQARNAADRAQALRRLDVFVTSLTSRQAPLHAACFAAWRERLLAVRAMKKRSAAVARSGAWQDRAAAARALGAWQQAVRYAATVAVVTVASSIPAHLSIYESIYVSIYYLSIYLYMYVCVCVCMHAYVAVQTRQAQLHAYMHRWQP